MDQMAGGISLVKPTSSQENIPGTQVDTPLSPPPPPITPTMPVEQSASTLRRSSRQRGRNGHVPHNGTCRRRENGKGSRGRAESSSRGCREGDDEDGDDVHVHHVHVEPQQPKSTLGMSNGWPNKSNEDSKKRKDRGGVKSRDRGCREVDNEDGEDNDDHHARDDEEGQDIEEKPNEGDKHQMAATNTNDEDNHHLHLTTPNNETTSTTRSRTKWLHDPGGETRAQGCKPLSVGLEGEKIKPMSLNVEPDNVKTNNDHAEDNDHTQQLSRHPVGTTDGDKPHPNRPTEPPDDKEGE
ncbi:hypothetical protein BDN67DRAFT_1016158 [Paxillus ammoniavirescens]|nr:hypothetical protein BDN67DRAFT_1016158 [Paxillus ammoniavirescens]